MTAVATPPTLAHPAALWVFPAVCYIGFAALFVAGAIDFRRTHRLSITSLALVAGTTMWWAEWFGDWGAYLRYNPAFAHLTWGRSTWTTPDKPWFMIPAYGLYYAVAIPIGLKLVGAVRRRFPNLNPTLALLVLVPYFLVEDLLIEIPATHLGWWRYAQVWGPALRSSRSPLPLLYPMFFTTLFVVTGAWLIDCRDANNVCAFEHRFGIDKLEAGARREISRLAVWIATLNAAYVATLIAPLVLIRLVFGPSSAYVP